MMWWIMGAVALAFVAFYLLWVFLQARAEVRQAPHVDMFSCDKHGLFKRSLAIKSNIFMSDNSEHLVCPLCLEDAEKVATERLRHMQTHPEKR